MKEWFEFYKPLVYEPGKQWGISSKHNLIRDRLLPMCGVVGLKQSQREEV